MDLIKLQTKKFTELFNSRVGNDDLTVKETDEYRWFELGGEGVQAIMSLKAPEQLILPIPQAMLLFLLWKKSPLKILNLGLGGASFERSLNIISNIDMTSVEQSKKVIDMAKMYFKLPQSTRVKCQKAEQFVECTQSKFDVVLCDMYIEEKCPYFLFEAEFYQQLKKITQNKAVVLLNLYAESEEQLLLALFKIKKSFPYIALIDFDNYKNVVVVCSTHEIPERNTLRENLANYKKIDLPELHKIIPRIRYIPH